MCCERNHGNVVLYFGVRAAEPLGTAAIKDGRDDPRCLGGRGIARSSICQYLSSIIALVSQTERYMIRLLNRARLNRSQHVHIGTSVTRIS